MRGIGNILDVGRDENGHILWSEGYVERSYACERKSPEV